ncbi:MAG: hypothetical protein EOO39_44340 [Cytophagaceae bacterium]|nr:MAG: hypothetical protein EOO39_44340 [Cytophagaceae bacterium]
MESANSNQVDALPTHWASVTLTGQAGDGKVSLGWTPAEGATDYKIYQDSGSGPALIATVTPVATTTSAGTHYTKTGLTNNTSYTYFIVVGYGGTTSTHPSNSLILTPAVTGYYNGVDYVTWDWSNDKTAQTNVFYTSGTGGKSKGTFETGPEGVQFIGLTNYGSSIGLGDGEASSTCITTKVINWYWETSNATLYPAPTIIPEYSFAALSIGQSHWANGGFAGASTVMYALLPLEGVAEDFGEQTEPSNFSDAYSYVYLGSQRSGSFQTKQTLYVNPAVSATAPNASASAHAELTVNAKFGLGLVPPLP